LTARAARPKIPDISSSHGTPIPFARSSVIRGLAWLTVLSLGSAAGAGAQLAGRPRYVMRTWPLAAEASAAITDMAIDSQGYLYLATGAGLLRFDGQRVVRQTINDLPLLESNRVNAITASAEGIWIGTPEGRLLHLVRGRVRDSLAPFTDRSVDDGVRSVAILPDGVLLAMSRFRVSRYREGRWQELQWESTGQRPGVTSFVVTRRGTVFIGTDRGLFELAGSSLRPVSLPDEERIAALGPIVTALAEDVAGDVWIGTPSGLFLRAPDGRIGRVEQPAAVRGGVEAVAIDEEGILWLGGTFGLVAARAQWDGGAVSLETVYTVPAEPADAAVRLVLSDGRGSVVVPTGVSGIRVVTRSPVRMLGVEDGLPQRYVHNIIGDGAGGLWVTSTCGGVTRLGTQGVRRYDVGQFGIVNGCVRSVLRDSLGALWIGQTRMVSRVAPDGRALVAYTTDEERYTAGPMLSDGAGGIWLGMRPDGLRRVSREGVVSVPPEASRLAEVPVWSIAHGAQGGLWVGQVGTVTLFSGAQARTFGAADGVPPGPIRVILPDADGTLWLASYGGGLARYRDGRFQRLTTKAGLFDDALSAIVPDDVGRLWLMGNRGVSVVRRSQVDSVLAGTARMVEGATLGSEVGVPEGNGGFPAGWSDGRLFYFASVDGVTVIDPGALTVPRTTPRAIFESLVTPDGELYLDDDPVIPAGLDGAVLRVTAPAIAGPDIGFRYRVAGQQSGWIDMGAERTVPLSELSPGRHTIEVAARGPNGAWSAPPTALTLEIKGRWWQGWAFRLLVLGLAATAVVVVLRSRLAAAEARTLELRNEIARRELAEVEAQQRLHELAHLSRVAFAGELATSLAHELNQPLAAIVSNADAARRMLTMPGVPGGEDEVQEALRDISAEGKRASSVIRTLRDFLGRGSPEHVPVDLAETIGEVLPVLRHMLDRHRTTVVVQGVTDLPRVPGNRIALQQVLMNLIVNAVEAMREVPEPLRLIEISGRHQEDEVIICVRDHGPGVPLETQSAIFERFASTKPDGMGMGLAISRSIVEAHDGDLTVDNAPDGGAIFCLVLPTVDVTDGPPSARGPA
jgi:signal transduction histidine kinase/ligand-binding sensor domain-containing protein